MKPRPPELTNTLETLEAAKAALLDAQASYGIKQAEAREAAIRTDLARQRVNREREALAAAQVALADALRNNSPLDKHQRAATAARANIEALEVLIQEAQAQQTAAETAVYNATGPVGRAENEIVNAQYHHLIGQYLDLMPPVVKIARELRSLSHQLRQSLELSGLMVDPAKPNVGLYTLQEDGTVITLLR